MYTVSFSEDSHKWFSLLILAGIPFLVIWKWAKNELPYADQPQKKQ